MRHVCICTATTVDDTHFCTVYGTVLLKPLGGVSLGGGMLVALGVHWRLANEHALAGWHEVNLGFCQVHRAHNACRVSLVIVRGVDFITSGVPLPAKHAAQLGSATCGSRR